MTFSSFVQHGVAVDVIDQTKHTPLFRAAEMGHTDVLKTLVAGKDKFYLDKTCFTVTPCGHPDTKYIQIKQTIQYKTR